MAAAPDVEEELVPITELDKKAGGCLLGTGIRHSSAQRHDPHLVRRELLGAGIVDVQLRLGGLGRFLPGGSQLRGEVAQKGADDEEHDRSESFRAHPRDSVGSCSRCQARI